MRSKPVISLILSVILPCAAFAQISVPNEVAPYAPIVAMCVTPASGEVQIIWESDESTHWVSVGDGRTLHAWASPGEHRLAATTFSVDWDAKKFAVVKHTAVFRVGAAPAPTPPVPTPPTPEPPQPVPPTPQKLSAYLIHETEDDTPAIARLFIALRSGGAAKWIKDKGHKLAILDDDSQDENGQPSAIVAKLKESGQPIPSLWILGGDGSVLSVKPIANATTADNVVEWMRQAGG